MKLSARVALVIFFNNRGLRTTVSVARSEQPDGEDGEGTRLRLSFRTKNIIMVG